MLRMTKMIRKNELILETNNIREARDFLTALTLLHPFYIEQNGKIYQIKEIRDLRLTIQCAANIESLDKENIMR